MIAIQLPPDVERRLGALAAETGRSPELLASEAIVEYVGDLEDLYLAHARAQAHAPGVALDDVEQQLGLDDRVRPRGA